MRGRRINKVINDAGQEKVNNVIALIGVDGFDGSVSSISVIPLFFAHLLTRHDPVNTASS
jgi:hypothetical protein